MVRNLSISHSTSHWDTPTIISLIRYILLVCVSLSLRCESCGSQLLRLMKIVCDVCDSDEASVFCTDDEAALCNACDHGVHHANKLASKHRRFSLLQPSPKQLPLCDICLERKAFLFCQQDRAILCRECDAPIHSANQHTQKHDRFLLAGMKVSVTASLYSSSPSNANTVAHTPDRVSQHPNSRSSVKCSVSGAPSVAHPLMPAKIVPSPILSMPIIKTVGNVVDETAGFDGSGSSIAEYLIETLPGWHVEDILDSSATSGFYSKNDDGLLDSVIESNLGSLAQQSGEDWVPQAPDSHYFAQMVGQIGFNFEKETQNVRDTVPISRDDVFTVPQISSASVLRC